MRELNNRYMATNLNNTLSTQTARQPNWIKIATAGLAVLIVIVGVMILRDVSAPPVPRTDLERDLLLAQQGVENHPKKAEPHNDLGAVYAKMGLFSKSEAEFKKAIKLRPKLTLAHFNLALVYKKQSEWDLAEKEFKQAIKLSPEFETAMFKLGETYMEAGEPKKAINLYQQALASRPDAADTLYNLGKAYEADGQREMALEKYEAAIRFIPDYQEAQTALAALKEKGKQ